MKTGTVHFAPLDDLLDLKSIPHITSTYKCLNFGLFRDHAFTIMSKWLKGIDLFIGLSPQKGACTTFEFL